MFIYSKEIRDKKAPFIADIWTFPKKKVKTLRNNPRCFRPKKKKKKKRVLPFPGKHVSSEREFIQTLYPRCKEVLIRASPMETFHEWKELANLKPSMIQGNGG